MFSPSCPCGEAGLWSIDGILQCQKISDFLIALAYFSIPLELFYFVSCSTFFPFRWIFLQFGAFIVLCGLTHFVTVWTYEPHSFQIMLSLTILKFLTALVSFATSITLLTLIPQMLRVMVREGLLRKKTSELNREVGMMKRQEETRWHVRMLTHEIRRSLDRHTILYTTLVELSKVLFLENCAVWMPDDAGLNLTHELKRVDDSNHPTFIPLDDPAVADVIGDKAIRVLEPNSKFLRGQDCGPTAAVRVPLLRISNFKGGTPQMVDARYAVLVLVLPLDGARQWGPHDLEVVEVVADQVAVALSHAAVVEESLLMKEKLMEQNMALERARTDALMASRARHSFQKVMSQEVSLPARSIGSILLILLQEDLKPEQLAMVDPMVKLSRLLSTIAEDATNVSTFEAGKIELDLHPFSVGSIVRNVVSISSLLCTSYDVKFEYEISRLFPYYAVGDEKRILQLLLYMIWNLLNDGHQGTFFLGIHVESGSRSGQDPESPTWRRVAFEEQLQLKFEAKHGFVREGAGAILIRKGKFQVDDGFCLPICKKLAQLMNGELSVMPNYQGFGKDMDLTIRLPLKKSMDTILIKHGDQQTAASLLRRMNILLADGDNFNRYIMRKLLERLGCHFSIVFSWYQCLETLRLNHDGFQLLLIDFHLLQENFQEMESRVRKLRSGSCLVIIAMVYTADIEIRNRCLQSGIHGVVCKPVVLHEVEEELQRINQQLKHRDIL